MKKLFIGVMLGLTFSACSSTFIYKYYVYDYEAKMLRGPSPSDDLSSDICAYSNEYKCIVVKLDEFYRLKADYQKKELRIKELEKKCE